MASADLIKKFIAYHHDITRRVWDSVDKIAELQFLADDAYSRGSIRNLLVHLANTDRNWLQGLLNLPRLDFKPYEAYTDRESVRRYWNSVAEEVAAYAGNLTEQEHDQNPAQIPGPRCEVLLHLVNHGTDHRSTILQKLNEYGAPTFDQDFILWLARA
jgi:uncharacterized damage-inducible protein DinB